MNWDRLEGQWKQQRGKAEHYWGWMMNDELSAILGKYQEFVGRLQEKYGIAKEQVDKSRTTIGRLKKPNGRLVKLQKVLSEKRNAKSKMKSKETPRRNTVEDM